MLMRGKTVVITGCLTGIGRETLDLFAKNGADIFACVQEINNDFSIYIDELMQENDVKIKPVSFNLSAEDSIKTALREILNSKVKIDALLNIAGITHNALFHMTSIEKFREVFEIDFFSQMLITQYISKLMIKQKSGSIVNVSSVSAIDGNAGQVAHSAAKAALIGATKTLAMELGESGIRVNCVAPGVIETNMTQSLPENKFSALVEKTALSRAGKAEEVAKVLLYLASDISSYVTGQIIRIDGGM